MSSALTSHPIAVETGFRKEVAEVRLEPLLPFPCPVSHGPWYKSCYGSSFSAESLGKSDLLTAGPYY